MRNSLAVLALCLAATPALAHVTLAEPNAAPGTRYAAQFRVGHGCDGKPTTALTVTIPPGVTQVVPEAPPGWNTAIVREGSRVTAVTWKGGTLPGDKAGSFTVTMILPQSSGQLAFPAMQMCGTAEENWNEMPAAGAALKHPAPLLTLAAAPAAAPGLSIADGWFRALPGTLPAGGYFTLRNGGTKAAVLTGAESPACGTLMLHKSESQGGMAAMDMVSSVAVPAGGGVSFAPGGYHLMCMDAKPMLKPGASVKVTLLFQDGGRLAADFAVRNAAGK
jgi:periplasmic copper chaperone A